MNDATGDARATGESSGQDAGATAGFDAPTRRTFVRTAGAGVGAAALGGGLSTAFGQSGGATSYNLAEALQKSVYLYDANECGTDVSETSELDWRGDCHDQHDPAIPLEPPVGESGTNLPSSFISTHSDVLDPDGTGTVDVAGGYHDAGDHVKFGVPEAYAASTLAWSVDEFESAFRDVGNYGHILGHLRRFAEYFRKCTFRNDAGEVVTFCHQVGNGGSEFDHNYWGPAELQTTDVSTRPAYFATPDDPAGAATAGAAAALAAIGTVFQGEDDDFAADCVDDARALYDFAVANPGVQDYSASYYDPSGSADERCWAAIWLHEATGEQGFVEDVLGETSDGTFTGHVSDIVTSRSDTWRNRWVHSWDSVWGGVLLKLGAITGDQYWWDLTRWHLEWWSGGEVSHVDDTGGFITTTPAGFSWLNRWGSARYNAAAQLTALAYRNYHDTDHARALTDWALGQMEYIMGDNPFGYSLIVGFTDDYASHPHHDTAHGSASGEPTEPLDHRHTLWGALVGGPDSDDTHEDATDNYTLNEVAIDFNAGFVGALAGHYTFYGGDGEPVSPFPPSKEDEDPFYVEAFVSSSSDSRIDVKSFLHNVQFVPAEYEDGLSFRYFLDLSGMIDNGTPASEVEVSLTYDQIASQSDGASTTVRGPEPWDEENGIYYVEFDASGYDLHGAVEISFGIAHYTADGFDPSTDPSRQGLTSSRALAENIPVYVDGQHVFGTLPDGTTPPDDTPTPTDTPTPSDTPTPTPESCDAPAAPAWSDGSTPYDVDDDGVYEDLNGNCEFDSDDVVTYFQEIDRDAIQNNPSYYDANGNGNADFDDVVTLFQQL